MSGQPPDTASISFECGLSISCMTVSLTDVALRLELVGQARIAFRAQLRLELVAPRQDEPPVRLDLEHLAVSPTRPSGIMIRHGAPGFHSHSCHVSAQYWRVNSGSISACHSFSGVVRM